MKKNKMDKKSNGFTLVEVVVVMAILGVLATLSVPRLAGFRNFAEERVCDVSRKSLEREYVAFMFQNELVHDDNIFNQFLANNYPVVCPTDSVISYEDGKVKCSVHYSGSADNEEPPGEEVPWL